jgi:hypothetical protein
MESESGAAHTAFQAYLGMGVGRSFVGAARQLKKAESLIRRWAHQYDWRGRAWAFDQKQQQADATTLRQERDEAIRRAMRDAQHVKRLAMGKFAKLVHRDPVTGEVTVDDIPSRVAYWLYKLGMEIERDVERMLNLEAEAPAAAQTIYSEMGLAADDELREIIRLAKERMNEGKEDNEDADK